MEALASLNLAAPPADAANAPARTARSGSEQSSDFSQVLQGVLRKDAGDVSTNPAAAPAAEGNPENGSAEQGAILDRPIPSKRSALRASGQLDESQPEGDAGQTSVVVAALAGAVSLWLFLPAAQVQAASAGAGDSASGKVEQAADAPATQAARTNGRTPDAATATSATADVGAPLGGRSQVDVESFVVPDLPKDGTTSDAESSALVDGTPEQSAAVRAGATPGALEVAVNVSGDAALQSTPLPVGQVKPTADGANQMASMLKQVRELQADSPVATPAAVSLSVDKSSSGPAQGLQSQVAGVRERSRLFLLTHNAKAAAISQKQPEAAGETVPAAPPAGNAAPVNPQQTGPESDGSSEASSEKKGTSAESAAKTVATTMLADASAGAASASQPQGSAISSASSAHPALAIGQPAHEVNAADGSGPSTQPHAATAPSTWHLPDAETGRFVNAAQLVDSAGHSEMRIALQTDKLGNVELRARIAGDDVGAAITVERRDAHAALAVELPALQQALAAKQLRVDQVALLHGSLNAATGDARHGGQQQMSPSPRMQGTAWAIATAAHVAGAQESASSSIFDSQGRLNVRA